MPEPFWKGVQAFLCEKMVIRGRDNKKRLTNRIMLRYNYFSTCYKCKTDGGL